MNTDTATDADHPYDFETEPHDGRTVELQSVVVDYDDQPDRQTVYPSGASDFERMSAWLTADATAFVELDTIR